MRYSLNGTIPPTRLLHAAVQTMMYGVVITSRWSFDAICGASLPALKDDIVDLSDQTLGAQWHLVDQSGPNTSYLASLVAINNTLYSFISTVDRTA